MPLRFLLIDDDADDIELFSEALNEATTDAELEYFDDGAQLMHATVNNTIKKPDIIFLDINMSTISGWDCLQFMQSHKIFDGVPIIMYSTSSHKKEIKLAEVNGAIGFITKPSSFRQLILLLKKITTSSLSELPELLSSF